MESRGIDRDTAAAQLAALGEDRAAPPDRAMVVAGAVLGVAVAVLGRGWGRAYAAELRAGL